MILENKPYSPSNLSSYRYFIRIRCIYIELLCSLIGYILKSTIFWYITPCSPLSVNLLARWILTELISSTLKMETICSSETSVDTQRTTWRYIPEDGTLHNHRCKNFKSYMLHIISLFMNISPIGIDSISCNDVFKTESKEPRTTKLLSLDSLHSLLYVVQIPSTFSLPSFRQTFAQASVKKSRTDCTASGEIIIFLS
jgi:hypothetical protein